jgi:integrase
VTRATIDQFKIHRRETWVNPNGYPVKSEVDVSHHTRRGAKAKTINFEVACIGTAFNLAVKWNYLKENPTKGVTKLKVEKSKQPRFLSTEEIDRLLKFAPADLYPIIFTFINTGMRKAELENLQWGDVDLKRRQISIRAKATWLPKTGERIIPINDKLLEVLESHKANANKLTKDSYVFGEPDGSKLKSKLRDQFIRVAKKAAIEDLTKLHTLRHTFASHLVMKGVDLPTVQKLMGHSDIETTMIYSHLAESHLVDAVNKL